MKTKGELTREKILEVAQELFNIKGFNATTISDLVEATGMQKGSLYFHFNGKDDIAKAVFDLASEQFMDFLDRALDADDPAGSIDNFFHCALDKHLATGFVGGCIFGNTALEMSDSDPDFARNIEKVFDAWIGKITIVVKAAQDRKQIRDDIPGDALARQIVATIEGGIMISRLKKDERPMRECLEILRTTLDLKP